MCERVCVRQVRPGDGTQGYPPLEGTRLGADGGGGGLSIAHTLPGN